MTPGPRCWKLLLGFLPFLAASCASYSSLRFAPPIQDVELRDASPEARLTVAWRGVVERDEGHELRFRIRFESIGSTVFALGAEDFELLDGALTLFGAARTAGLPTEVGPGGSTTFELNFPPAAGRELGAHDLSALCLRARFADGRWSSSSSFERVELHRHPDPYWDSPFRFHFGLFWCD